MKIFKLSQSQNCGYDTYDAIVVASEDEESARLIRPDPCGWNDRWSTWCHSPSLVEVEYIGEAKEGLSSGIILKSFNAG